MSAGATLVQCYSGLIFRGPALIGECVDAIRRRREAPSRGAVAPL
jgi:dihydroorotate dehydrogenase